MILLISAYIADLIIGDPQWLPHPVRWMGRLIGFLDKRWNKCPITLGKEESSGKAVDWFMRIKGIALGLIVIGTSISLAYLFIEVLGKIHPLLGAAAWIYTAYTTFAIKDLWVKAKAVLEELETGSIDIARDKLSMIVGRDTQQLQKDEIITATIESVAESTNDGVIAPLFYLILGGTVLAIAYRAINTLDSMVGYKNERYINLGWFSARLDDAANFIPARICGFLIPVSSFLLGKGFSSSFKIMLRDHKNHASPNSGIPEAAMAGALKIRLGGDAWYNGHLHKRPFMGESGREVVPSLINQALIICFVSSFQLIVIGVIIMKIFYCEGH
ncbi:cobalamin biosynthesis protein CobD [Candidatus Desantisbacteria bacterium]|nr:cobalamin biosynthesis protein CobD [Candidatus Desantisbacteria bacterium]